MNSSALSTSSRIHYVIATDMTGRRASYFVQVEPRKEPLFLKAVRGKHIRFDQYGTIVVSCYGEKPTPDAKRLLKERYNYDADFTEAPLHYTPVSTLASLRCATLREPARVKTSEFARL